MKKIVIGLVVGMTMLAGCGGSSANEPKKEETTQQQETTKQQVTCTPPTNGYADTCNVATLVKDTNYKLQVKLISVSRTQDTGTFFFAEDQNTKKIVELLFLTKDIETQGLKADAVTGSIIDGTAKYAGLDISVGVFPSFTYVEYTVSS